jgi:hypothetical protein
LFELIGFRVFVLLIVEVDFHVKEAEFGLSELVDLLSDVIAAVVFSDGVDGVVSVDFLLILNT